MNDTAAEASAKSRLVFIEKKLTEVLVELAQTTATCWQQEWTESAGRLTTAQGELRMGLEDIQRARGDLS